jgi:hypothetical protein
MEGLLSGTTTIKAHIWGLVQWSKGHRMEEMEKLESMR